jgi:hypothetical protein
MKEWVHQWGGGVKEPASSLQRAASSGGHGGISSWGRRPHLPATTPSPAPRSPAVLLPASRPAMRAPPGHSSPSPFLLPARNANSLPWAPPLVLLKVHLGP